MPAKLKNTYIVTDDVCALKIACYKEPIFALFDTRFLPKIRKEHWRYEGRIIQSDKHVALSTFVAELLERRSTYRIEPNDDYTESNFPSERSTIKVTALDISKNLRKYNTIYNKVDRKLGLESVVELKVILTTSEIIQIKVRNCDAYCVPYRLRESSDGVLYVLDAKDRTIASLQKHMIAKLDLPIFSLVTLADERDLSTDGMNFRGVGKRCVIEDPGEGAFMFMHLYCEPHDLPIDQQGRDCVTVKFNASAFDDVSRFRWRCSRGIIVALVSTHNDIGEPINVEMLLNRFLAECYNIDIGEYNIPGLATKTYTRMLAGEVRKLNRFIAKAANTPSIRAKRGTFTTKSRSRSYRIARYGVDSIALGVGCLDMSESTMRTYICNATKD